MNDNLECKNSEECAYIKKDVEFYKRNIKTWHDISLFTLKSECIVNLLFLLYLIFNLNTVYNLDLFPKIIYFISFLSFYILVSTNHAFINKNKEYISKIINEEDSDKINKKIKENGRIRKYLFLTGITFFILFKTYINFIY